MAFRRAASDGGRDERARGSARILEEAIRLRRRIHRHPEVGLDLPRTQEPVLEALDGLGYEIRTGRGTTSVIATFALDVARYVLGDDRVSVMAEPLMGAEDFSYVLHQVPGAMVRLGVAPPGIADPAPNHSNRMLLEESAMADGIALHTAWALRYLDGTPRSTEGEPASPPPGVRPLR